MYHTAMLTRLVQDTDVDVVMLSGHYTLLEHRARDDLLPACAERGVSVLAASVFNSGLLAMPRPAEGARFDYAPASLEILRRAHRIADVCETHGVTLPQVAMAFPLRHPAVAGIVIGMRSAEEVRYNAASFQADIPRAGLGRPTRRRAPRRTRTGTGMRRTQGAAGWPARSPASESYTCHRRPVGARPSRHDARPHALHLTRLTRRA
jgi:aryl-alcohol dehydrogenase-like predicted oxidoreductase